MAKEITGIEIRLTSGDGGEVVWETALGMSPTLWTQLPAEEISASAGRLAGRVVERELRRLASE